MSRALVESLREGYALPWGEEASMEIFEKFIAPDFELVDRTLPESAAELRGIEALRAEVAQMKDAFDSVAYDIEEVLDFDDRVVLRVKASATGKGSGILIGGTLGHVFSLRDGQVARLDIYGTWDETLRAVGLRE